MRDTVGSGRITYMTIFRPKSDQKLPKQFPEPIPVGKLDVGNFAERILQTLCKPEIT